MLFCAFCLEMLSLHVRFVMMFMKKIIKKIPTGLLSVLTIALIAYLSLDDDPFDASRVQLFEDADKVVHAIMYAFLTCVLVFDCAKSKISVGLKVKSICLCALVAFAFSMLMEYLQDAMGLGRAADIGDVIANFTGTVIGFLSMKYVFLKRIYEILRSEKC